MLEKFSRTIKVFSLLLVVSMIAVACGGASPPPVETPVMSIEEAVAQTVAAQNVLELQVEQTVAAALAEQGQGTPAEDGAGAQPVDAGGPDIADPAGGIEPVISVPDPNLASGTPQLRVNVSSANVRNGPGTNYRPISTLLRDSVVTVIAKNQNGSWFLIEFSGGSRGWIADSVTDPVVATDMVSVQVAVTIPAPPTFTPTATATKTAVPTNTPTPTNTAVATAAATPSVTPTATQPAPVQTFTQITVINNSTIEVCFLFIDLSAEPWSSDRLGPNDTLPTGFQITFDFPPGEYDFMAQDCSGNIVASLFNELVLSPITWEIR